VVKPLRTRLQEMRSRLGIPWEVLERDYVLSWVLAGIVQVAPLRDTLVFKGSTALVPGLPAVETVIGELRPQVTALISSGA
jgi:hypothetical protein